MKKILALLLALCPVIAGAAANSMLLEQRNSTNTGNVTRIVDFPATDGVFWYNTATNLPAVLTLGPNMVVSSGVLDSVPPTWSTLASKPTFATVAFTGNYGDLFGAPSPSTPTQSAATRSLNSAFQVSTTRPALVVYSVQITVTATIAGGQNGDVILEIASDSGFTTNVQTLSASGVGQTYSLAVALQGVQPQTQPVTGFVPAGYYVRLRTVQNTGTPTFSYRFGQETLF